MGFWSLTRLALIAPVSVLSLVAQRAHALSTLDVAIEWQPALSLTEKIAIVDTDNREIRTPENTKAFKSIDLEGNQGLIWCRKNGLDTPSKDPTKVALLGYYAFANATMVFENNIILVNRHNFVSEDGAVKYKPTSCYYQYIQTGQLVKLTSKIAFPNYTPDGKHISYLNGDIALARLQEKIIFSTPLQLGDMIVSAPRSYQPDLTIIANAANNNKNGDSLSQTIAHCKWKTSLNIGENTTRLVATNCATGLGSSGSQVYVIDSTVHPKLFGVVAGEIKDNAEGSGYVPLKLSTIIETFDDSLPALYVKLKSLDNSLSVPDTAEPKP